MQRVRDGNLTRTYRVRIPRHMKPGRQVLALKGAEEASADDLLLELLFGDDFEDGPGSGPRHLKDLIHEIHGLGIWDGVRLRMAGHRKRAFRDANLVISGHAKTAVRVAKR
jgi:hypothetical protein